MGGQPQQGDAGNLTGLAPMAALHILPVPMIAPPPHHPPPPPPCPQNSKNYN